MLEFNEKMEAEANRPCARKEIESKPVKDGFPVPIFPGAIVTGTVYENSKHDDKRGETHRWEVGIRTYPSVK